MSSMLLLMCQMVSAQSRQITGTVTDQQGQPIPGATVVVKGTSRGVTTGSEGTYTIQVDKDKDVLVFSFIGMVSREQTVGNRKVIDVSLEEDAVNIDAIVVDQGYGQAVRKVDLTGSIAMIDGKEILKSPTATAAEALTGKIPGLQITTTEGAPGAEITIKVRGGTSITQDNSPLYVIDGFPSDLGISDIDASQIESIVVLKDASSTAIYGARGANGVILVTTRSGTAGKTKVSYNGYVSMRKMARYLDVMTPYEFAILRFEQVSNSADGYAGLESTYGKWDDLYDNFGNTPGIDWQRELFDNLGLAQNHTVIVEGGSEQTRFNANMTYYDEKGILLGSEADKLSLKLKLNHDTKDKKFRFSFNTSYTESSVDGDKQYGRSGKLISAVMMRPMTTLNETTVDLMSEPIDEETMTGSANDWMLNPVIESQSEIRATIKRTVLFNGSVEWKIFKDLSFRAMGGLQSSTGIADKAYLSDSGDARKAGGPSASITTDHGRKWNSSFTLTYAKKFGDEHAFDVMIGNEEVLDSERTLGASALRFESDAIMIDRLQLGQEYGQPTSSASKTTLSSFFGRVNYSFGHRYLLTATIRRDGSSIFSKENRWGTFPSVALAWRVSEEKFMKNLTWIDNLKFRFSYGETGNNRIPADQWQKIYSFDYYGMNDGMATSASPSNLMNPNLKWESLVSRNVGLDFTLFGGRINGTVDLYLNSSKDLLLNAEVRPESGFTTQYVNIGKTENKGIEIALSSVNVKTKNFTWTSDFNITFNRNRVVALADGDYFLTATDYYKQTSNDYIVKVGLPIGSMYGYRVHPNKFYRTSDFEEDPFNPGTYRLKPGIPYLAGTTPEPGDIRFEDLGDGNSVAYVDAMGPDGEIYQVETPLIDDNDRTVIGNANPKFYGGFNNTFTYKNWDLSIFLNFVYGNTIYNANRYRFTSSYSSKQNMLAEMGNRFLTINESGEYLLKGRQYANLAELERINKNATIWRPFSDMTLTNSWNMEDGSFLRLNNVTLGYTFPSRWLNKLRISRLRLYFTGMNLFVLTRYSGFDPEVDTHSSSITPGMDYSAYPKTRQYVFGINLTF